MRKIRVHLGDRSYDIFIGRDLIRHCGRKIRALNIGRDAVIITNKKLLCLYGNALKRSLECAGITAKFELIPDSEKAKSSKVALRCLQDIASFDTRKKIVIIAFGGGVVGDLAGFVASTYKRGVPYIQIPTTLLAQVDSAIGGKVAIDLPAAKNLVGSFYQPRMVISDVGVLGSLPGRQVKSALAEVIKYGVISDEKLFSFIENHLAKILSRDPRALEHIVTRCSAIKAAIVEKDELDRKGKRAVLNFGHTIGHALEAAGGYSGRLNHGEAVAIGMAAAAEIAFWLGLVGIRDYKRLRHLIESSGLSLVAGKMPLSKVYRAHMHDKKFSGRSNKFILPRRIGKVSIVESVPDFMITAVLKKILK
jgi:3-dehydroquinate synthase